MMKNAHIARPVLRWAGGKTWLTKYLPDVLRNTTFRNYHEPFVGGAAIFLFLDPPNKSVLSDLNADLIKTYLTIKYHPQEVIESLQQFHNTKECYYRIRGQRFENRIDQASRFIFLNQTNFNGLYRVNQQGEYNVPYGNRKKEFIEPEKILTLSRRLQRAKLLHGDFQKTLKFVDKNDLVFLDPPYTVSHNNNGFLRYNDNLFSLDDQHRLSKAIDEIKKREAYYILTNAAHKTIVEIFEKGDCRQIRSRASSIAGQKSSRGQKEEYLFTNLPLK